MLWDWLVYLRTIKSLIWVKSQHACSVRGLVPTLVHHWTVLQIRSLSRCMNFKGCHGVTNRPSKWSWPQPYIARTHVVALSLSLSAETHNICLADIVGNRKHLTMLFIPLLTSRILGFAAVLLDGTHDFAHSFLLAGCCRRSTKWDYLCTISYWI